MRILIQPYSLLWSVQKKSFQTYFSQLNNALLKFRTYFFLNNKFEGIEYGSNMDPDPKHCLYHMLLVRKQLLIMSKVI